MTYKNTIKILRICKVLKKKKTISTHRKANNFIQKVITDHRFLSQ